jgi:predicted ATPase
MLHQYRRDGQAAQEQAEAAIELSREQGFVLWLAGGTIFRGWALTEQGQREEGIAQIHQGTADFQATGADRFRPYFLALLAEAYGKVGQTEEGLTVLAEAMAVAQKDEDHLYEPELYRLKGELVLQSAVHSPQSEIPNTQHLTPNTQTEAEAEAEACFLKAIEIAQKQQAKSLELRATMSLVRLRQQQATQYASRSTHHARRSTQHVVRDLRLVHGRV